MLGTEALLLVREGFREDCEVVLSGCALRLGVHANASASRPLASDEACVAVLNVRASSAPPEEGWTAHVAAR